jgi:hypothetical protein
VGTKNGQSVQIGLPMAEVLSLLEKGLGELVRKVGKVFIESLLEAEVEQLAGPRSRTNATRQAYRSAAAVFRCLWIRKEHDQRAFH